MGFPIRATTIKIVFFFTLLISSSTLAVSSQEDSSSVNLKLADSLFERGEYDSSRVFYLTTLKLFREEADSLKVSDALYKIAVTHWYVGSYAAAMKFHLEALEIRETLQDSNRIGLSLLGIAYVHGKRMMYDKAVKYYQKAIPIFENGDLTHRANAYMGIGGSLAIMQELDEAYKYLTKAKEIFEQTGDIKGQAKSFSNLSLVSEYRGNLFKGIEELTHSVKLYESISDSSGLVIAFENIGNLHLKIAWNLQKSDSTRNEQQIRYHAQQVIDYSKRSYALAKKMNRMLDVVVSTRQIKNGYHLLGDLLNTIKYYDLYNNARTVYYNKQKNETLTEMEEKYQTAKKEQENELLKREQEINQSTIEQQRTLNIAAAVTAILLFIVAGVIYRSRQKQKKVNKELESKNNLINNQKAEIENQANELKEAVEKLKELDQFKNNLTSMIVHDLKNPLNSIINIPDNYSDSKKISYVNQNGKRMLNLVMNILDVNKYEESRMSLDIATVVLREISEKAINEVSLLADEKNILISNNIIQSLSVNADAEIIHRVFVNLLTNAIKYTPNNRTITVAAHSPQDNEVKIMVTDTGMGIEKDKLKFVFRKFGQIEARSSGGVRSTGIGLTFCKMAVEAHGHNIGVESELGRGTTFWFTLQKAESITKISGSDSAQLETYHNFSFIEIKEYADLLKDIPVYKISAIRKVVNLIGADASADLLYWKEEILKAARNGNEEVYLSLLGEKNE